MRQEALYLLRGQPGRKRLPASATEWSKQSTRVTRTAVGHEQAELIRMQREQIRLLTQLLRERGINSSTV
jgi:hypothetical protein